MGRRGPRARPRRPRRRGPRRRADRDESDRRSRPTSRTARPWRRAADRVEQELGEIDVWVNDAMVGVFGEFLEMDPDDFDRAVHVDFLGFVNGTRAALSRMKPRNRGGVVQVGSALGHRGIPLQSAYCASKHAIKGFTESVLTELLHDGSAVTLSEVDMPAMNTVQFDWVKSSLPKHAQPVPPIYQPEICAKVVVDVAERPRRRTWVGESTVFTIIGNRLGTRVADWYLARSGYSGQQAARRRPSHPAAEPLPAVERGGPGRARRVRPSVVADHAADLGDPASTRCRMRPPASLRRRPRHWRPVRCGESHDEDRVGRPRRRGRASGARRDRSGRARTASARHGSRADRFPSAVLRVLGLRQVVQGVATARGGASAHAVGGCIDALHAPLDARDSLPPRHRYRRAAGIAGRRRRDVGDARAEPPVRRGRLRAPTLMSDVLTTLPSGRSVALNAFGDPAADRLVVICHPSPGSSGFDPDPVVTNRWGVHLVGLDRPGYGGTDPLPAGAHHSLSERADDVADFIAGDERNADQISAADMQHCGVIGWGTGGLSQLPSLPANPDRVDRLALIAPPAPERAERLGRRALDAGPGIAALGVTEDDPDLSRHLGLLRRLERMLESAQTQGDAGIRADLAMFADRDWLGDLQQISAQTRLWIGTRDPLVSERDIEWWGARIRGARAQRVKRSGSLAIASVWPQVLAHVAPQHGRIVESERDSGNVFLADVDAVHPERG